MSPVQFGQHLSTLRKSVGLTRRDLARRARVSRRTLEGWELGRNGPCLLVSARLAEVLGISLDRLAGRT